jgi:hypothetical protein
LLNKFACLTVLAVIVYAFTIIDPGVQTITGKLEQFRKKYPQEKVYLHTDKPFYSVGDTLYYKAYIVNAENNYPSAISHILYIDLINSRHEVQQTSMLPTEDGISWGSITLSDSLPEGPYRLRAYTSWMRNFDEAYFFTKTVPVGNALSGKINAAGTQVSDPATTVPAFTSAVAARPKVLQFFPEGGQLINGLPARMGFKALQSNGLGIAVTGTVQEDDGKDILRFQSGFAGLGSFRFTPQAGHQYTAMVKYADGSQEKISLPPALAAGYSLSADNADMGKVNISIATQGITEPAVIMVAQSNSRVLKAEKLTLVNGKATTTLPKTNLPAGIVQLTLFDAQTRPVAERLVFIEPEEHLQINLVPEKTNYKSAEQIKMAIEVKDETDDPVAGNFSVSVVNGNQVPMDRSQASIVSHLLLTADLRGYVEYPAWYFTDTDVPQRKALDDLMLTQGWRRFTWNDLLADKELPLAFKAEQSLAIRGKVMTSAGAPVANAKVTLITKKGRSGMADTLTNNAGEFVFDRLYFVDSMPIALQAIAPNGNKDLTITVDSFAAPVVGAEARMAAVNSVPDSSLRHYLVHNKPWLQEEARKRVIDRKGTMLKEVTVKAKIPNKIAEAVAPSANLNGPGHADHILTYLDIRNCADLTVCLPGKLAGVWFKAAIVNGQQTYIAYSTRSTRNPPGPMLILLDGMDVGDELFSLKRIPAGDVQSIEVLQPGVYASTYGFRGNNGVMVITTKRGGLDYEGLDDLKKKNTLPPKGSLFTTIKSYAADREFYQPAYMPGSPVAQDLRSTVYWQPNLLTDEQGKAGISFFNTAPPGKYHVMIEGISGDGRTGTAFFTYEVVK